jgi:hypothetical protein
VVFRPLLILVLALTAGCSSVDPQAYRSDAPTLDLQRYFNGTVVGHGMVLDRSGQVQRRFVVTIDAQWADGIGTLDEHFVWSDGERERRVWTLRSDGRDGATTRWTGLADDVIGEARGVASGNTLNWSYTMRLATANGGSYRIAFNDWMHLIDDQVMLNRAVMTFFGVRVGEVFISFARQP